MRIGRMRRGIGIGIKVEEGGERGYGSSRG